MKNSLRFLRYRLRVPLIKLMLGLSAALPLRVNHLIGGLFGAIGARLPGGSRRVCTRNLEHCLPELKPAQRHALRSASLRETGKTLMESGALWSWPRERTLALVTRINGEQALSDAMALGRGALLVAPHLGCWEIVGLYLSSLHQMTSLYRPLRIPEFDAIVRQARERYGARLVPAGTQGVRGLIKALREGGLVGILPDQDPGKDNGEFAPFFGVQANTMTLLPRLANKTGAPVIGGYAKRLPHGQGYELNLMRLSDDIGDDNLHTGLRALNREVERMVRECLEQYQWPYKRFRTRPPGEADFYD